MWDKILDLKKCYLQADPSNDIRNAVKEFAIENDLEFFNTRNQTGFLRTMMIRTSCTGDIMVLIQFFKEDKQTRIFFKFYCDSNFHKSHLYNMLSMEKLMIRFTIKNVICYKGRDHIFEEMEGLRFKINAKSFYQTNSAQAYELYKITRTLQV